MPDYLQSSVRQPKYSYLVSKPSSSSTQNATSFNSYRDNSYNTEQRKQVLSYPTSSSQYSSTTTRSNAAEPLLSSSSSSYNTRPDYGSTTFLDSKPDYEPYGSISYGGSKADVSHYSPMESPAKAPIYEDRVSTVLRKYPKYSTGP